MSRCFAQKVSFGNSLLCGPLRISAFSAFNGHSYAEAVHRGRRETNQISGLFVQAMSRSGKTLLLTA